MKTHWFSVFGIAGIILLAGNSVGNELRWGKPANSTPVASSVIQIPTAMTQDMMPQDTMIDSLEIVQTQYTPPGMPRMAPPVMMQPDYEYIETSPLNRPVPPGATFQSAPMPMIQPMPMIHNEPPSRASGTAPATTGRGLVTTCGDQIVLKSIREISHDIRPAHTDQLPEECVIDRPVYYGRHFGQTCFMWKASALSTQAAYFEDVQLERYGNTIVCPALQPVVSGAKFFATIPILPYKMGVTPPNECVYTLGHRRPGNYAPYMVEPFPVSPRGALFQALAVTGVIFAIP